MATLLFAAIGLNLAYLVISIGIFLRIFHIARVQGKLLQQSEYPVLTLSLQFFWQIFHLAGDKPHEKTVFRPCCTDGIALNSELYVFIRTKTPNIGKFSYRLS